MSVLWMIAGFALGYLAGLISAAIRVKRATDEINAIVSDTMAILRGSRQP